MSQAINHHYVPQFLLRNFTEPGTPYVHAFDKHNNRRFRPNIRNVASVSGLYDPKEGHTADFEGMLSQLENIAAPMVDRVVSHGNLGCISQVDRGELAYFIAFQWLRTPHIVALLKQMREFMEERNSIPIGVR